VPAAYADVDGSSVWILKWHVASPEPRRFACATRALWRVSAMPLAASTPRADAARPLLWCADTPAPASARIAQQSGANITFDVVRLPAEIYYSSPLNMNTNDTAARVIYLLEELGYDCVAGAVFVWPARMQFFRYLLPHQPYGFQARAAADVLGTARCRAAAHCSPRALASQVVTTAPTWTREGLFSRLFKFARPFDWRMWLLMAGSIFVSGLVITYYERNTGGARA
jgi:hypothetical protein